MLDGEPRSRGPHRWPWTRTALGIISGVATIGVLVVVVEHRQSQFPTSRNCPAAAIVNGALGTQTAGPSSVSEVDLLGCFYPEGSDAQAVTVSFAIPGAVDGDPCARRHRVRVSGHEACDVTGSRGTSTKGRSLLVEARLQYQFSSDGSRVSLDQLERLATTTLALPPPPVQHGSGE